jgi:hypothetical protein
MTQSGLLEDNSRVNEILLVLSILLFGLGIAQADQRPRLVATRLQVFNLRCTCLT